MPESGNWRNCILQDTVSTRHSFHLVLKLTVYRPLLMASVLQVTFHVSVSECQITCHNTLERSRCNTKHSLSVILWLITMLRNQHPNIWYYHKSKQSIKMKRHHFANKGLSSRSYSFSSSHVWMWELDCKERWALKNWCFWTVVLEKTLESPLDW